MRESFPVQKGGACDSEINKFPSVHNLIELKIYFSKVQKKGLARQTGFFRKGWGKDGKYKDKNHLKVH